MPMRLMLNVHETNAPRKAREAGCHVAAGQRS